MKTNEEFFDSISSFYDKMINFDLAIERRKEALRNFIEPEMHTAADVGSGTGLDSIALALLGQEVTGFDLSSKMIEQAELNSRIYNTNIRFVQASADGIPSEYRNQFDIVCSTGNTIANIEPVRIVEAVKNIYTLLSNKGKILLQILNFGRIITKNDRIVNITEKDHWYYVRFYDLYETEIDFNILKFNKDDLSKRELITTKLFKYSPSYLKEILEKQGFNNVRFYENLNMKKFDLNSSRDLIITAEK